MEETVRMRGDVTITITGKNGEKEVVEIRNLIVNGGKTIEAKRLAGDGAYANEAIGKIAFGTGNAAPTAGDTTLAAQVLAKAVTVSYPAYNQVKFSATMTDVEGGTNTYQELGLLTATSNMLFSRVVINPIVKSSAYQIQVDWLISFQ